MENLQTNAVETAKHNYQIDGSDIFADIETRINNSYRLAHILQDTYFDTPDFDETPEGQINYRVEYKNMQAICSSINTMLYEIIGKLDALSENID